MWGRWLYISLVQDSDKFIEPIMSCTSEEFLFGIFELCFRTSCVFFEPISCRGAALLTLQQGERLANTGLRDGVKDQATDYEENVHLPRKIDSLSSNNVRLISSSETHSIILGG